MSCYRKYAGGTFDSSQWDAPCPNQKPSVNGYVGCCGRGSACLYDGLCQYNSTHHGGTGMYTQSCTDSSYEDSACQQACTNSYTSDVAFNASTQLWACCSVLSNGNSDCAVPSNLTFTADPLWPFYIHADAIDSPDATETAQATSASQTASATVASSVASNVPQVATCTPQVSHHLTTGAQAAIGVVAALAGLIIIACIIWLVLLSRRLQQLRKENQQLLNGSQGSLAEKQQQQQQPPQQQQMFSPTQSIHSNSLYKPPTHELQQGFEYRNEMSSNFAPMRSELGQ